MPTPRQARGSRDLEDTISVLKQEVASLQGQLASEQRMAQVKQALHVQLQTEIDNLLQKLRAETGNSARLQEQVQAGGLLEPGHHTDRSVANARRPLGVDAPCRSRSRR